MTHHAPPLRLVLHPAPQVLVVTDAFDGMPPLKRHRVVNEVLKEEIGMIHAITLKTFTQKQWGANGQAQWKACKDE